MPKKRKGKAAAGNAGLDGVAVLANSPAASAAATAVAAADRRSRKGPSQRPATAPVPVRRLLREVDDSDDSDSDSDSDDDDDDDDDGSSARSGVSAGAGVSEDSVRITHTKTQITTTHTPRAAAAAAAAAGAGARTPRRRRNNKGGGKRAGAATPTSGGGGSTTTTTVVTQRVVVHHRRTGCGCFCQYLLVGALVLAAVWMAKVKIDPTDQWGPSVANATNTLERFLADEDRPGLQLAQEGFKPHFPMVFVPGIISTALEVWQGEPCARRNFRERIWGSALMIKSIVFDSRCWLRHMMLNHTTGLDPDGIRLRPSAGLEAADYIIGGYWVWAKVIENAADIGYDTNSMFMAPYDWRLALPDLERRDAYFSRLKAQIEIARRLNGDRKCVVVCHSMGSLVLHYFMQWVQSASGGNAGPHWVAQHLHAVVYIGGPMLGVPKSISALVSGEMRDTAELAPFINFLRNQLIFSNNDVVAMMRSFRSVPSMLPKGGTRIWGNATFAPDDIDDDTALADYAQDIPVARALAEGAGEEDSVGPDYADMNGRGRAAAQQHDGHARTHTPMPPADRPAPRAAAPSKGAMIAFTERWAHAVHLVSDRNATAPSSSASQTLRDSIRAMVSAALAGDEAAAGKAAEAVDVEPPRGVDGGWLLNVEESVDLLRTIAPDYMTHIDALYSTGCATTDATTPLADAPEYAHPRFWSNPLESALPHAPDLKYYCLYGVGKESERAYAYLNNSLTSDPLPFSLNTSVNIPGRVSHGVAVTSGDATVPLISLGFMCAKGWKHPRYNPSGSKTIIREYLDDGPTGLGTAHSGINFMRRVTSSDHVDIMGNYQLIEDLLRVASAGGPHVHDVLSRPLTVRGDQDAPPAPGEELSAALREAQAVARENALNGYVLPEKIVSKIREISARVSLD